MNNLHSLIYYSETAPGVSASMVDEIVATARANNRRRHLTGALAWDGRYFVQEVEGHRLALGSLLQRLFQDDRHQNLVVCGFQAIEARRWPEWAMANLSWHGAFTGQLAFQPYELAASELQRLLVLAQGHVMRTGGDHRKGGLP